jgi:hypothetical protein
VFPKIEVQSEPQTRRSKSFKNPLTQVHQGASRPPLSASFHSVNKSKFREAPFTLSMSTRGQLSEAKLAVPWIATPRLTSMMSAVASFPDPTHLEIHSGSVGRTMHDRQLRWKLQIPKPPRSRFEEHAFMFRVCKSRSEAACSGCAPPRLFSVNADTRAHRNSQCHCTACAAHCQTLDLYLLSGWNTRLM